MPKFKVGQKVKIVDSGRVYPTFDRMARELRATEWINDFVPVKGAKGYIKAIDQHEKIALIKMFDNSYGEFLDPMTGETQTYEILGIKIIEEKIIIKEEIIYG
jgi:hypothetical protein